MFKVSRKNRIASAVTTAGDCSWNPQPSSWPPARNANTTPASATNESTTPAANTRPCIRIAASLPCACCEKPRTLSEITGNTQGIRLRIKPPINASAMAATRPGASWPAPPT
ncbi:MAG: hypothetical protein IPI73_02990 [Betaproteobacteria bacterium]|nr:hypothetical protein [Betaproteobacteria bacterium]